MINIKAYETEGVYTIEVEGHAEYNPGNDIVCAAVSTLIQTYAASAENHIGGSSVVFYAAEHGKARVSATECSDLYRFCVLGLSMLAETYPKNVKIEIK